MSLDSLRLLTVQPYPSSTKRPLHFAELERLYLDLLRSGVRCEMWIDGSFLTDKVEPCDIDLSISGFAVDWDLLPDHIIDSMLRMLNGGKLYSPVLDTYMVARFLMDDPRFAADKSDYWMEKWSVGWDDMLKGCAIVEVRPGNVGS